MLDRTVSKVLISETILVLYPNNINNNKLFNLIIFCPVIVNFS